MDAFSFKQISWGAFTTLIFPGFLFSALTGLFLTWVDRKVAAIVQSRVGPPWYQPYADVGKLLGKKMLMPAGARGVSFLAAPLLAVGGATLASAITLQALFYPSAGFVGDLIVLVYLATLPSLALIIGGAASRSPFGAIGAGREMNMILAYEAGFLLALISVMVKTGSVTFSGILAYQAAQGPLVLSLSGFLAFVVALFCTQAKLGFLPFDIPEAETELIGGPLAEYSGAGLALFKLSRAILFLQLPVLLVLLFLGAPVATPLSVLSFLVKLLLIVSLLIVAKTTHARLRLDQALRLFWGRLAVVGLIAAAFAFIGW